MEPDKIQGILRWMEDVESYQNQTQTYTPRRRIGFSFNFSKAFRSAQHKPKDGSRLENEQQVGRGGRASVTGSSSSNGPGLTEDDSESNGACNAPVGVPVLSDATNGTGSHDVVRLWLATIVSVP